MPIKLLKYSLIDKALLKSIQDENKKIKSQIEDATNFIKDIEDGKLDTQYNDDGNNENQLVKALLSMQSQLKKISLEEQNRNWVTEGLAKFADILRKSNDDINQLGDRIISNLVRYLNANQGGIFVLNEDESDNPYLELIACYAYDRKKHLIKKVNIGEGLVGQTFLEKETIYMTELPPNYTTITSGLGASTPGNLVLIPLKVNDEILGILEIASFKPLEEYKVEFLEKIGESIASTLTSFRISHQTTRLLKESQLQTEHLRSQEEEVRQNMEELSSTQEEMQRILKEVETKEKYLNELINVPKDSIFTIDRDYKLLSFNRSFSGALEAMGLKLEKGFDFMQLFPDEKEKQKQKALYDRAFRGENFEQTDSYEGNGQMMYYLGNYAPLYNDQHEVFAVACFSKDVTALITAQKQSEKLLADVKLKEQYLNELINVPKDSIFTLDKDFKLLSFNKALSATVEVMGIKLETGFDFMQFFPDEKEKQKQKALYGRAFKGENFEHMEQYENNGLMTYYLGNYAPLYNEDKEIFAVACFTKDVTSLVKAQKQTEELLEVSKLKTEEIQAQEEEMRQNLEELSATQEEMQRVLIEVEGKEKYLNELINVSKDNIFTLDKDLRLISFNKVFSKTLEGMGIVLDKGFDFMQLFPTEKEKEAQKKLYERVFRGENFEQIDEYETEGVMSYYLGSYAPLYDENKNVFAAAMFTKDITEMVKAQKQADALLVDSKQKTEELQAQEEEIRQNMEELAATQEEMQRVLKEVEGKEKYLNELINVPKDSIFTLDKDFRLISFNKSFSKALEVMGIPIEKGFDFMQLFPDEKQKQNQKEIYQRAFRGENFEKVEEYETNGEITYYLGNYAPLYNEHKEIFAVACFTKDITEMMKAKKQADSLLTDSKQKTEEMEKAMVELQNKEHYLDELINVPKDTIFTIDRNYQVLSFNKSLTTGLDAMGIKVEKGFEILQLFPSVEEKQKQIALYDRAFKGENFEQTDSFGEGPQKMYYMSNLAPLCDENGKVFAVASFSKDVTALVKAQKQAEILMHQFKNAQENSQVQDDSCLTHIALVVDRNYKVVNFNQEAELAFKSLTLKLNIGTDILKLFGKKQTELSKGYLDRALAGETFDILFGFGDDNTQRMKINYYPLKGNSGEVTGVIVLAKQNENVLVENEEFHNVSN